MKIHRRRSLRRAVATALAIPIVMGGVLIGPAPATAQEQPEPAESRVPVPVDQLPPLNLPELPNDSRDPVEGGERPVVPDPPPPRPLPSGPAKVRADIPMSGVRHFKLFYDGQPIGWSKYRITGQMKLGETDALILSSEGELKLGFGTIAPSHFVSRLMLDRQTLRPAYFKCQQKTGEQIFEVECVYSESMVAQTNTTGDNRSVHFHNFEGEAPQLLFNNLWGHLDTFPEHYWVMARSAVNGGTVKAYDPILRGEGEVIVYEPRTEPYNYLGRTLTSKVYDITDLNGTMLASVRVAADSFELLEVDEIGSGLKIVKAEPGVEERLAGIEGVDLSGARIVESNVVFPDPEQLTALEAEVEIDLRGGQLVDHRIAGYRQYFTGELVEGVMRGRVFVRSVPREVPFDTPYPLDDEIPAEIAPLLEAGPGVEMEFPPLATKAREIAWKSPTTFDAAKRLNSYVHDLEEGVSLPSARYALESGVGNAESKALLLVAMSRAVKLPARKISGIAFRDGNWVPHHWVEVWLGQKVGWTPFDPSSGEAGRVGAAHIALLDSGDVQNINIRVTDYAPRATKKVPYIARELQWDIGEQRTYGVYRDGERVGTEVASVGDVAVRGDEEVFHFKARSEVETESGRQVTVARQLLTPQALPRQIILEHGAPEGSETITYDFTEDTVVIRPGQPGEEAYESSRGREYPFAKGTYFTDPRLMTHWVLMAGQVPLEADGEKEFPLHTFVPGAKSSEELLLEVGEPEDVVLEPRLGVDRREEGEETEGSSDAPSEEPGDAPEPEEEAGGETGDPSESARATHLITDSGVELWINEQSQIVKVEVPDQGLELILEKVETVLE